MLKRFIIGLVAFASVARTVQNCFDETANKNLPFEVIQQAPPPLDAHESNYRYFPLSASASMDLESLNRSRAPLDLYSFLWANRCHDLGSNAGVCGWNKKGNLVAPRMTTATGEVRTFFTSFQRANDCTLAQAARLLGYPGKTIDDYGKRSGLTIMPKGPETLARQRNNQLVDVCLIDKEPLAPRASGIVLDYEVQDRRMPEQTLAFLKEFAALVHGKGKKAVLYTNPLDAPTQRYTGVAVSNAHQLYEAFDRIALVLWHRNRQGDIAASARAQIEMIRAGGKVDAKRLLAVFELNETTIAEAATVRKLILSEGMAGVMFWRNYAKAGGDCSSPANRKIACIVTGKCE
jgi:hypothetical protein